MGSGRYLCRSYRPHGCHESHESPRCRQDAAQQHAKQHSVSTEHHHQALTTPTHPSPSHCYNNFRTKSKPRPVNTARGRRHSSR